MSAKVEWAGPFAVRLTRVPSWPPIELDDAVLDGPFTETKEMAFGRLAVSPAPAPDRPPRAVRPRSTPAPPV